jgi:ectoine hydroxylase-related dioxygenase (phytanoyl-CoA dioxygenase family)
LLPSDYAPELRDHPVRSRALALARQLLGDDAVDTGDHAINKPARSTAVTPWHQDEAYWDPAREYRSLSVWLPLQDVDVLNGCMQFLPGSHRQEVLPHQPINNDPAVHGLELVQVPDTSAAIACPLAAGGATVHFSRTVHFTGDNRTDAPRRAYIMTFGVAPQPRAEAREFPWLEIQRTARAARAEASGRTDRPGA